MIIIICKCYSDVMNIYSTEFWIEKVFNQLLITQAICASFLIVIQLTNWFN